MKTDKSLVIIPTYNEKDNIGMIIGKITALYPEMEIWVVDDSSPDGTGELVTGLSVRNPRIKLFTRKEKNGLGNAYKYIHAKIQRDPTIRYIVTMDADGSHDPRAVRDLLEALKTHDLAIGSRYVHGGKTVGWDFKRLALSYLGNLYSRLITGSPIHDGTAGFVAFRREVIDDVDFSSISGAGYAYQIEFKNALVKKGAQYREVPITFTERQIGKSKMSGNIIIEGLIMPWRILAKDKRVLLERLSYLGAFVCIIVGLLFATYKLKESPSVWYDEGIYIQSAVNFLETGKMGFQLSPDSITHISRVSVSYPLVMPLAAWFKIFGVSVVSARSFMVVSLMIFLIAAYIFVCRRRGGMMALGTLFLLVTFPPLYGNGKSVLGEIPALMYLTLALLFFDIYMSRSARYFPWLVCAGICAGLAIATKTAFLVLIPALVIGFVYAWRRHEIQGKEGAMVIMATFVPLIAWYFIQLAPGESLTQLFGFYANPYGVDDLGATVARNIVELVSNATPLLLVGMMGVWLLACGICWQKKISIPTGEVVAFVFSFLIVLSFLRMVGWYRYIFPAQIAALIFFVPSLVIVGEWIRRRWFLVSRYITSLVIIVVVGMGSVGVYGVLFDSWVANYYHSGKTAFWENYFENISGDKVLFFYDTPELTIFSPHRNYYQFIQPAGGPFSLKELDAIRGGIVDVIFVRTDAYGVGKEGLFGRGYSPIQEVYKYTILGKK